MNRREFSKSVLMVGMGVGPGSAMGSRAGARRGRYRGDCGFVVGRLKYDIET